MRRGVEFGLGMFDDVDAGTGAARRQRRDHDRQCVGESATRTPAAGHGFPTDCIGQLRSDDRAGLINARLAILIDGERTFMVERGVTLPAEQTAPAIADSESSDDE